MTYNPIFCEALRQAILDGNALCLTESDNNERNELFLGGIVISKEVNEILWFAVAQHGRGQKGGTVLLTEAMKRFDHMRPIVVTTFDKPFAFVQRLMNRLISSVRYRVEQGIGTLKRGYGFSRMRYTGLTKGNMEFILTAITFNLKKAALMVRA